MSPDDLIPVYDTPCKCGQGRIVVKKYPPAPEFVVEIFSHLVSEIQCPDCAKEYTLAEGEGAVCLLRTTDVMAKKKEAAAYCQRIENVEKLADSTGYYDVLVDWFLSFESIDVALKALGHLSPFQDFYWKREFPKAFGARPDPVPMKALVKSYAGCSDIYRIMKSSGKSYPELERLVEEWKQQKLSIVPIVEKLCLYGSPLARGHLL